MTHGVPSKQITTKGFGASHPIAIPRARSSRNRGSDRPEPI
jgi:outer membrane protein OmpA-like peptidoglycan-associated protein